MRIVNKVRHWTPKELRYLKTRYRELESEGQLKSVIICSLAYELHRTCSSIESQIAITNPSKIFPKWTDEEIEIVMKHRTARGTIKQSVLYNEVLPLLSERNWKALRSKCKHIGVSIEYKKSPEKKKEERSTSAGTTIGAKDDGNIYFKAAALINGEYKNGALFKNNRQLTAAQILDAIRMVKEGRL